MQSNKSSFDNDGQRIKKWIQWRIIVEFFTCMYDFIINVQMWLFSALKFKQWTKGCQGSVNYDNS